MRKGSTILIIISFLLFLILISSGGLMYLLLRNVREDALSINSAGIIRGSIQRLVKNELSGVQRNNILREIDFRLQLCRGLLHEHTYQRSLDAIEKQWNELRGQIYEYRNKPSSVLSRGMLQRSEDLWRLADENVRIAQNISEKKIRNFYLYFAFFGINFILVLLIIFLIYRIVKQKLEVSAYYDFLTKAYNREYFTSFLQLEIEKAERYKNDFLFLYFDIDHFKRINDSYGHHIGDYILSTLADLLRNTIRKSDILARIGGEEFCIVAHIRDRDEGLGFAEKIRKTVEEFQFKKVGTVTVSIGGTFFQHGDTFLSLLTRTDKAMYEIKKGGRNGYKLV